MKGTNLQGAFRRVNAEVQGCVREMTAVLKERLVTQKDSAAECVELIRMLGEPIESLQVVTHAMPCRQEIDHSHVHAVSCSTESP